MPIVMPNGQTEYVGWFCVEADRTVFEIVRDVALRKGKGKRDKGKGIRALELEMLASCEPGSLRVVSAMALGSCACAVGSIVMTRSKGQVVAAVEVQAVWPYGQGPTAVRVRIEGVRKGHTEQWPRFTEAQFESNNEFWGAAKEIGVA